MKQHFGEYLIKLKKVCRIKKHIKNLFNISQIDNKK